MEYSFLQFKHFNKESMMKKTVLAIFTILLTMTLMGCPPITTQPLEMQSTPRSEMLFDLPEGASIISESFDIALTETQTNQYPDMHVYGTYVIQNDGSDATLNMLYPTLMYSSFYDIPFIHSSLRVIINHIQEELQWNFSSLQEDQMTSLEITYDYFNQYIVSDIEDPSSITVHKYVFDCPQSDTDEELTLVVPEGTFILYEYYMEHTVTDYGTSSTNVQNLFFQYDGTETTIPSFSKDTSLTIYTINNSADFIANYDFNGIHEVDNLANIVNENQGTIYDAKYLVYTIEQNQNQGLDSIHLDSFLFNSRYFDSSVLSMFTLEIPLQGNGVQTTVEVSFPSLEYGTEVDGDIRYLFYDFYLDTQRYVDMSIPVTFTIQTDFDIVLISNNISHMSTIDDFSIGTRLHFEFSTVYEEPESS